MDKSGKMDKKTKLVGILNITKDSFSDGNLYIEKEEAIKKAYSLWEEGASIIDIGAQSTNPDSAILTVEEELSRLLPVLKVLNKSGLEISIDSYKANVLKRVLSIDCVKMLNDISALSGLDEELKELLKNKKGIKVVLMHTANQSKVLEAGKALKMKWESKSYIEKIIIFFETRLNELVKLGLGEGRFILDPGMGFFLSNSAKASLNVLKELDKLKRHFVNNELYISVSRKSFIGEALGGREAYDRASGTLLAELYAYSKGADYIRTHDVKQLSDALKLLDKIEKA